jgi:hypothetical protein
MPQNLERFEQGRPQRAILPGSLLDNNLTQPALLGRRRRHRRGPDAAVLTDPIYDAPATVALLEMIECERNHLGTPQAAA